MKFVIALILVAFSYAALAQDSSELDKCSQTLANVESSLGTLDQKKVDALLASVNSTCLGSVEYAERSNELVYAVATAKPIYFMNSFGRRSREVQRNILEEMKSPINDGIDLKKAYRAINSVRESKEKSEVLSAIKVAASKMGLSL